MCQETSEAHTQLMAVFMQPDSEIVEKTCQRQAYHHTVAVYDGKDNAAGLAQHFQGVTDELAVLMQDGFKWRGQHIMPHVTMPADMASHVGITKC